MVFFLTLEEEETNNLFELLPACSELSGHSPGLGPLWLHVLGCTTHGFRLAFPGVLCDTQCHLAEFGDLCLGYDLA